MNSNATGTITGDTLILVCSSDRHANIFAIWKQKWFSEFSVYETGSIENCYSVKKFQDQEKHECVKNTKAMVIRSKKKGKLWAIIMYF